METFWARVDKSGPRHPALGSPCWLWTGYRHKDGYGEFNHSPVNGKSRREAAHRVSWVLANGRRPGNGKEICHRCDNPPCVNPEHLFEGTHRENVHDMIHKGRAVYVVSGKGGANPRAKITDVQAQQIRIAALDPTVRLETLGRMYGLSLSAMHELLAGKTFAHLPFDPVPRRRNANSPRGVDGIKCPRCSVTKVFSEFSPSVVSRGGGWCRECHTDHYRTKRQAASVGGCDPLP